MGDGSVPIYDLLKQNNREWDAYTQEYKKFINSKQPLIIELEDFVNDIEEALINAELLDSQFIETKLGPELAACMTSGYIADRNVAKENIEFEFWIYRATWAGADPTRIMFSIPFFTKQQLNFQRIENLSNKATDLGNSVDYKMLVNKLKSDKKRLIKRLEKIKKLIK